MAPRPNYYLGNTTLVVTEVKPQKRPLGWAAQNRPISVRTGVCVWHHFCSIVEVFFGLTLRLVYRRLGVLTRNPQYLLTREKLNRVRLDSRRRIRFVISYLSLVIYQWPMANEPQGSKAVNGYEQNLPKKHPLPTVNFAQPSASDLSV